MLRAVSLALVFACLALAVADQRQRQQMPVRRPAAPPERSMIQGLRTVVYHVDDLSKARQWYASVLGHDPYFDQPFYVGFNVGGYELGLSPDVINTKGGSAYAYWGVGDCKAAYQRLLDLGAKAHEPPQEVGGDIVVATVTDPWGNIFGVIENPHFKAEAAGE